MCYNKKVINNNLFRKKMGVIVNKEQEKDDVLTRRINADLRTRAKESADADGVDLVEDAEYLKNTNKTGRFAWVWVVLIVLAILSLVLIIFL